MDHDRRTPHLTAHIARAVESLERGRGSTLAPWPQAVIGEGGHGPDALPWDGRFREQQEFERDRWADILTRCTRSWVNLVAVGVRDERLVLMLTYLTNSLDKRTVPLSDVRIVIAGGPFDPAKVLADARW